MAAPPPSNEILLGRAKQHMRFKEWERAVDCLDDILREPKDHPVGTEFVPDKEVSCITKYPYTYCTCRFAAGKIKESAGYPSRSRAWARLNLILMFHSSCPTTLPILPISHQPEQNWADSGTARVSTQPRFETRWVTL